MPFDELATRRSLPFSATTSTSLANVACHKRSTPPPVPLKSITLLQEIAKSNAAAERSNFQRLGSDRTPHRPAPPVPAPGQVPVHRAQPRPERHHSSPAGLSFAEEQPTLAEEPNETSPDPSQAEETVRKRRREQRQNVISELALTEMKYIRDLTITYETFNLHTPQYLEAKGIDPTLLFGNILEIIHTSENLLEKIHLSMKGKAEEDQLIAPSFLEMAEELRAVYGRYCMSHEKALALLAKCTEDSHQDKANLLVVVRKMTDVASSINESKRRNDIVLKYLEDGNRTLSTRISKFSFHSVAKMSSRLGMKLSSSLGIGTIIKDPAFEEQEQMFHTLEKAVRMFIKNVESFMAILHDVVMTQLRCAEAIADFYKETKDTANVDEFRMAQHTLVAEVFPTFTQDELNLAKHNYEALNSQLLEELPKLNTLASNIYVDCIAKFISERKMFSGRVTKQYLELMNLPVMIGCTGDVVDVLDMFKVKHNIVSSDLATFSFSSKQFKQDGTLKRNSKLSPNVTARGEPTSAIHQSPSQKAYLLSRYSPENLFIVSETHISAEVLELSVAENSVVGVIKKQDPMANTERWFVDVGGSSVRGCTKPFTEKPKKDFCPGDVYAPCMQLSMSPQSQTEQPPPRYDEVVSQSPSPEPVDLDNTQHDNQSHLYEEIPENEFYYAEYDFTSLGADFISLKKGQVVNVVHKHDVVGNSEWWYVENRTGESGYVPANYLVKYNT
ncbi:hypothetical protein B566_EDAN014127 [Ephemera danica]|nr:hypothetical protein B566_EDAN014127 [Ephemera danica]